ncbi:two-component regulator propeller domain-containing protein [Flexithrix dorotheae]|uniref:two-component regulator propeller domain-containing protein n=1 Tax=Flexithrix dorotheae TaxID=70993 RepID=UPI000382A950|nr:two-component regulator propeller domain-containing protein [Flexithrix dorotheae]
MNYYLIALFISFITCSHLQGQHYNIRKFSSKDGLAQNHCLTVAIDSNENLWVGTYEGGISKFNGHTFQSYNQRDGLSSSFIFDINQQNPEEIWFATANGISNFNGQRFENYLTSDFNSVKIRSLVFSKDKKLWFYHEDDGLGYIENQGVVYLNNENLYDLTVSELFIDKSGKIWIGTYAQGLYILDGKDLWHYSYHKGLKSNTVYSIYQEDNGNVMVGTNLGISYFNEYLEEKATPFPQLDQEKIHTIFKDSKGKMWFGTESGAFVFDHQELKVINENNGLADLILDITEDHDGGLWFCSNRGLFRLNNFAFTTYNTTNGLNDNLIWSLAFSKDGTLWSCSEKGVNILQGNTFKDVPNLPRALESSPSPVISDKNGNIVIGAVSAIYVFTENRFKKVLNKTTEENEFYTTAFERKNGDLLFGGTNGVSVYNGEEFKTLIHRDSLNGRHVNAIEEDHLGRLWLATEGDGIYIYEKNGNLKNLNRIHGNIPNNVVNSILIDSRKNIWFGTSGNGIWKIPDADENSTPIGFEDLSLNSSNIYSIIEDDSGNIWIGTDRGLNELLILQNDYVKVKSFGIAEGFLPLEVCNNSVAKDSLGNIWFGTVEGIVKLNPKATILSERPVHTTFTGIKLFFKEMNWGEFAENINTWNNLPKNQTLELSYEENHLQFDFIATGYCIPEKIKYQWKLQGFDKDWSPATRTNKAIYPNLEPGKYTLQVRASNAAGIFNENPNEFSFLITKPFYHTGIFWTLLILISISVLLFYYKLRVNKLKENQQKLQRKVSQRTQEIEEQKTEIHAQSKKLKKAFEEIDRKNQDLVKVNQNVQNSINYARKIQEAIMFSDEKVNRCIPDSFIFFKPKEVVSSDFYWVKEYENYIFIILVDCTGNGVPGAFMSLIGYEYLTQIIDLKQVNDPAEILNELNKKVIKELRHGGENSLVDALDVAICRINKQNNELKFSGARRPLVYIEDGKINQIKGSFSSAGINMNHAQVSFTNSTIKLSPETCVYLFSDGYPNQFSKHGEKFKIGNFKKLLLDIHQLKFETQKERLQQRLEEWSGNTGQLDDILILGFKFYNTNMEPQLSNLKIKTLNIIKGSKK